MKVIESLVIKIRKSFYGPSFFNSFSITFASFAILRLCQFFLDLSPVHFLFFGRQAPWQWCFNKTVANILKSLTQNRQTRNDFFAAVIIDDVTDDFFKILQIL